MCKQQHECHAPHVHACRGFKALKQVVKLHYRLNQKDKMLASYRWARSGASTAASSMCSHVAQPAVWPHWQNCCLSQTWPWYTHAEQFSARRAGEPLHT